MGEESDVKFVVESLYPLRARAAVTTYAPHWNPVELDTPHATLDLSHTAVSGSDALAMADELGSRLVHVHMADGTTPGLPDEHLVPGHGTQPCADLLGSLGSRGYTGRVGLEVNTRRALTTEERRADPGGVARLSPPSSGHDPERAGGAVKGEEVAGGSPRRAGSAARRAGQRHPPGATSPGSR